MLKFLLVADRQVAMGLDFIVVGVLLVRCSASAMNAQETCQLETMEGRCRWNSEVMVMTSARWGRMKTGSCLEAGSSLLNLHQNDPQFLGCYEDVLSVLDRKCSGRSQCDVRVPDADLDYFEPCYPELEKYLEVNYNCVRVVQESRRCVVSVTTEAQFISSSSSTSSDVNSGPSSCGSKSHPWRLKAAAGQRINISLLDFTAMSTPTPAAAAARNRGREAQSVTCRPYGYVLEKSNKKNVSVCAGSAAQLRQSHVYMSDTSNVEVVQLQNGDSQHVNFLIKLQAVGCTNMVPPENAWLRRSDNDIIIGCYSSQQTWQLNCDGREWKGLVGTCPEMYLPSEKKDSNSVSVSHKPPTLDTKVVLVMVIIGGGAVIICFIVIALGLFCMHRCKHAMRKQRNLNDSTLMSQQQRTQLACGDNAHITATLIRMP